MVYTLPNGAVIDINTGLRNQWNGGFVGEVKIRNTSAVLLDNWAITLDLPVGVTVVNAANTLFSQSGSSFTIQPNATWLNEISPGEEVVLTFRANGAIADAAAIMPVSFSEDGVDYPLDAAVAPDVISTLFVQSTWATGAWLQVTLENTTDSAIVDWSFDVTLPPGLTFASSGAVSFADNLDGTWTVTPKKAFLETIPAGQTIAFGFNLAGDSTQVGDVTLGVVTGETPPSAINDTITGYSFNGANGVLDFAIADILANDVSPDGGPLTVTKAFTVAGGGATQIVGDRIAYISNAADRGQIVIGYEILDSHGNIDTAQVFVDLPAPPVLDVSDVTVDEAAGKARFTVTLTGDLYRDAVLVDWTTRGRSALPGQDFVAATGALAFDAANRSRVIEVDLVNNNVRELSEIFNVVLSNPRGAEIGKHAGVATILDDAGDTGPLGFTTPGVTLSATLAGEFVVGYSLSVTMTNTSAATITQNPVFTIGVQDGMKLNLQPGSSVSQDGVTALLANHDDRYFTMAVNLAAPNIGGTILDDGAFDPGDTATFELFFSGSHFFVPVEERFEFNPPLVAELPDAPGGPLNLTYKGFNTTFFNRLEVTDADVKQSFQGIDAVGGDSVAIVSTHFMTNRTANVVKDNNFTMTDADLVAAIRDAKAQGLKVLLKPHIDLDDGSFRGRINPQNEAVFFGKQADGSYADGSYGELITRYAAIAQAEGADSMLIGVELVDMAKNRANLPFWTQLIDDVRAIYTGELSYASIVGEELFVRFWDQLDYIALDIYPPLTDAAAPSVGELVDGWTEQPTTERGLEAYFNLPVTDLLAGMAAQYGKKIVITETGFRSVDGSAARPFDFALDGFADLQEQMDAYEAFFTAMQDEAAPWLDGVFLWEWPNELPPSDGTIVDPKGYIPNNKPVLDLIEDFFLTA